MTVILADLDTVLYERPLDSVKAPMSRALGDACEDIFQQDIPHDENRSPVVFIKLLLLILFQLHIERLIRICQRTLPSTSHEMLYRGTANVPKTVARIRNLREYNKHVRELVDMTEFTASSLENESSGSSRVVRTEYILEIRSLSAQLAKSPKTTQSAISMVGTPTARS